MAQIEKPVRTLAIFAHGYQPTREVLLPDQSVMQVLPVVNEEIYQQCYKPVLADSGPLPAGLIFSFYASIRQWMIHSHPQEFAKIRENVQQMSDKEYSVLGDPFIHAILPLLPPDDQHSLLRIGKAAFVADFGFKPKGLWLPETAVSHQTLVSVRNTGYEFVVLRDSQLTSVEQNPMFVFLDEGKDMAVFHFDTGLSGDISFNQWSTMNADNFLRDWIPVEKPFVAVASDLELYEHHRPGTSKWLNYLLKQETLERNGFAPLFIRSALTLSNRKYTDVIDNSSWSCDHGLGRWTGNCGCDRATEATQQTKKHLLDTLTSSNQLINRSLDKLDPFWRIEFEDLLFGLRDKILTGGDFLTDLERTVSVEKFHHFAAKIYTMLGFTSCGWFFGKSDSPERKIPETMSKTAVGILDYNYLAGRTLALV